MAYTPINWQTGDTITAEKMNKMDNGWGVQNTQLFSETVTTVDTGQGFSAGALTYSTLISASTLVVTLNGTDYICPRIDSGGSYFYGGFDGAPDFTDYPFIIYSTSGLNQLITQTAGTYTVSAKVDDLEVSDQFVTAVKKANPVIAPMLCVDGATTFDEMQQAREDNRLLYFYSYGDCHFISGFSGIESETAVSAIPQGVQDIQTYGFTDDGEGNLIFTIFYY